MTASPHLPIRLHVEGWRGISHSYALVNQFQMMHWRKHHHAQIKHSDMPFIMAHWANGDNSAGFIGIIQHMWINDLQAYDLSVGTRVHGYIAAVLAGIPSVMLCHDSRTRELAQWFDLPRLDKTTDAYTPTVDSISECLQASKMHAVFKGRIQARSATLTNRKKEAADV